MKSKITLAFDNCKKEKRPALITYTVAGDNTINNSLKITLQVFTGLIFLLVVFLINSQTKILSSFSKSLTKK